MKKSCFGFKTLLALTLTAGALVACAQDAAKMSLTEARASIAQVVSTPKQMTETMQKLSEADQKAFLGEVNAAISKMPGSNAEKAAVFYAVNRAALKGAAKGTLRSLLAEVFATVPVEALPTISTGFADELFNRDADSAARMSDADFTKVAREVVGAVVERTADVDNGEVRSAFAAAMFVRASKTPDNKEIVDGIAAALPEKIRDTARTEWIPEAAGATPHYESMLAAADADVEQTMVQNLPVTGPQALDAMLGDLAGQATDPSAHVSDRTPIIDAMFNPHGQEAGMGGNRTPESTGPVGFRDPDDPTKPVVPMDPTKPVEPGPYPWQN